MEEAARHIDEVITDVRSRIERGEAGDPELACLFLNWLEILDQVGKSIEALQQRVDAIEQQLNMNAS